MSRTAPLAERLRRLRSSVALVLLTAPPTPMSLLRMFRDADSRLLEAVAGLMVGATVIQLALGHSDWPYRLWLLSVPLWGFALGGGMVALGLLVGSAGAQATREYNEALDPKHNLPCPYWPVRLACCIGAALFFATISLAIASTSVSTWGGVREAVFAFVAVMLAARHLYGRGVGPYA